VTIQFNVAGRYTIPIYTDKMALAYNYFSITDASGHLSDRIFFSPFNSISIDDFTVNKTTLPSAKETSNQDFWGGIGSWASEHWQDLLGGLLIIGGAVLILTGVGAGIGIGMIATGVGMLLYEHWDTFRNFIDNIVKNFVDFVVGIGTWIWKVVDAIWKAITWFVGVIIDYGGQLLAIIIYALAMIVPILMIYYTVKMMQVFLKMSKGDLEGAASEVREIVAEAKGMVGK
jgi:phage-related minor tail protein